MFCGYSLKQRIVIDINTAERMGIISDVEIDEITGKVQTVIIRRRCGFLCGIFRFGEMRVPWEAITAVGREFVLVKSTDFGEKYLKYAE